jgi:hypothetical protein
MEAEAGSKERRRQTRRMHSTTTRQPRRKGKCTDSELEGMLPSVPHIRIGSFEKKIQETGSMLQDWNIRLKCRSVDGTQH